MTAQNGWVGRIAVFLHRWMLPLLVGCYALAAIAPAPGEWLKDARLLQSSVVGHGFQVTLPKLLLSFLLFNAGLHVRFERLGELVRRPQTMLAGLAANMAVPLGFIVVLVDTSAYWRNPNEFSMLLVGLTLVAAMPIAGSSTAWTRAADGDMTLSLGLVVASTLASPISTPIVLGAIGSITPSPLGDDLSRLAAHGTSRFLMVWVLVPSLLGMLCRLLLGSERIARDESLLKSLASMTLLVLCYANSASCLRQTFGSPDWDFLLITAAIVTSLCVATFTAGYVLGRLLGLDYGGRSALMFGLGMNNNGTGLVLAGTALGAEPMVLLPVIAYNLAQHLVAGCANAIHRRSAA